MKTATFNSFMLRTVAALVLGLVLILWPSDALLWLAVAVGVLFLVTGLIAVIGYFARDRRIHPDTPFPVTGTGSLLFGLLLVVIPAFFIHVLMYILGAILLIGGIEQIVKLVRARKRGKVPLAYYAAPVLILIAGIVVLADPFRAAGTAFVILGASCLVYGIAELITWLKFSRKHDPAGYLPTD